MIQPAHLPDGEFFIQCFWDATSALPGEKMGISKTDVRRAYHTIGWTPAGSLKLAIKFAPDLIAMPIKCGFVQFGKWEPPYAFGLISRWLDFQHQKRMSRHHPPIDRPLSATFVDDTATMGSFRFLEAEVPASEDRISSDIHETAVNVNKRLIKQQLDLLGIRMDVHNERAGLSHKAYLKLVYVFFVVLPPVVTTSTMLPIKSIQCIASLARHYGFYIPPMRFSASILYQALRGRTGHLSSP